MPDGSAQTPVPALREGAPDLGGRAGEILDLARDAFVDKGFEATSMRDLARAAGMSVGNFYRYFPSKAALVEALIARDMAEMEENFRGIAAAPDPLAAVKASLRWKLSEECTDNHPLWAEICAAAARKPEIAALVAAMEDGIAANIARVLGHVTGLPPEEADVRLHAHGRLLVMLVQGAAMCDSTGRRAGPAFHALILRTAEGVIDDAVAGAATRGPQT